jgi:hypothetical protein
MALKDITITGSIGSYPTLSYGQKTYVSSTDEQSFPIEQFTGSAGGATPNFNGQYSTTDLFVNITQSWNGSLDTQVGIVDFTHDTQEEFINGEYSGSGIEVTHQRLIGEDCIQLLNVSTIPTNYKPFFYVAVNSTPFDPPDPDYVTVIDNFLNANTSPNPGEIYILSTSYKVQTPGGGGISTIKKVTHIKVNKLDDSGNDNTLSLQELDSLRILFSDLGVIIFPILSITEYPTYYLYSTDKTLPSGSLSSVDNNVLNYYFSASSLSSPYVFPVNGYLNYLLSSYNVSSPSTINSFNSSTGIYLANNTNNIPITLTASFTVDNSLGANPINISFFIASYPPPISSTFPTSIQFLTVLAGATQICEFTSSQVYLQENTEYVPFIILLPNNNTTPVEIYDLQWMFTQSANPNVSTNITILNPYLTGNFEYSDCNVLINNATNLEYNPNFYKVNYDTGLLVPTNQQQILDGTAEFAPVKPYNYSLNAQVFPRYNGVKTTAPDFNMSSSDETGYGGYIVAGNPKPFVGYYGTKGGSVPEVLGKTIINLDYIIDEDINTQVPALSDFTYGNQIQLFERGKYLYLDPDKNSTNQQFSGNNKYYIYRSGEYATPILYSQTGSDSGRINTLNFTQTPTTITIINDCQTSVLALTSSLYNSLYKIYSGSITSSNPISPNDLGTPWIPMVWNSSSFISANPASSNYSPLAAGTVLFRSSSVTNLNNGESINYGWFLLGTTSTYLVNAKVKLKIKTNPNIPQTISGGKLSFVFYKRDLSSPPTNLYPFFNANFSYNFVFKFVSYNVSLSPGNANIYDIEFDSDLFEPFTDIEDLSVLAKFDFNMDISSLSPFSEPYFLIEEGAFSLIQTPSPNNQSISYSNAAYILSITDHSNPNYSLITFNSSFSLVYNKLYPQLSGSGYDPTIYPFKILPESPDTLPSSEFEIRFAANENLVFPILQSYFNNLGRLVLKVYRNNTSLSSLDNTLRQSFLIRRWIPRAGYIYLNVAADLGAGIVKPEFITDGIQAKLPEIIKNLTDKGLIT